MPTLNHSQRQVLRAIKDHILTQQLRAGASYTQISTVGVIFHPESKEPALNVITPHRGVAWTRAEDLRQAFDVLSQHGRAPHMQYLRALFPEAFARQLHLQGLQKVAETPVWLYMPVQGPVLEGETLWGGIPQDTTPSSPIGVQEAVVKRDLAVWLRVHRTILYEVETPNVNPVAAIPLEEDRLRGKSLFLVGSYHQWPMAVTQVLLGDAVAQVVEPAVIWPWVGLGIEEALIERAINLALARNRQIIYTMGAPEYDPTTYRRLGFIQLTHLMTYSTSPESPT